MGASLLAVALAVPGAAFTFPGGSGSEFIRALSDHVGVPVVTEFDPDWRVPKISVTEPNRDQRLLKIARETGRRFVYPKTSPWGIAVIGAGFHTGNFHVQWRAILLARGKMWAPRATNPAATVGLEVTTVRDVLRVRKPEVKAHWYQEDMVIQFVAPKGINDRAFLKVLAKTVAGRVINDSKGDRLDLDIADLRDRIAHINASAQPPLLKADFEFQVLANRVLTNQQFAQLYAKKGTGLEIPIRTDSELFRASMKRLAAVRSNGDGPPNPHIGAIMNRIDWSRGTTLFFTPGGLPTQGFRLTDGAKAYF